MQLPPPSAVRAHTLSCRRREVASLCLPSAKRLLVAVVSRREAAGAAVDCTMDDEIIQQSFSLCSPPAALRCADDSVAAGSPMASRRTGALSSLPLSIKRRAQVWLEGRMARNVPIY